MTFFLQKHPELSARRADTTVRNEQTGKAGALGRDVLDARPCRGYGWHGTLREPAEFFFAVMRSLLASDGRLLSSAAVDEFFRPAADRGCQGVAESKFLSNERWNLLMGGFLPYGLRKDHGLGWYPSC
ncbi:MAG: hypothetical protein LQ340_000836 [Diploschistes diacapsis]|nr:MAG: hypothetical protein LQ340_000836 [Diploschistes diacapsis]